MSKRNLVLSTFFAGTLFAIVRLTWIGMSGSSSANAVPAPETKPVSDGIEVREYGPERNAIPNNNCVAGVDIRAYRQQSGQQPVYYGVEIDGDAAGEEIQISLEDAEKLLAFYKKFKGKTKSRAKEIERAYVKFSTTSLKGAKVEFDYDLKNQLFSMVEPPYPCDPPFFDALDAAISDAKAMKKVPLSVTPE